VNAGLFLLVLAGLVLLADPRNAQALVAGIDRLGAPVVPPVSPPNDRSVPWHLPARAIPYMEAIYQAEARYNLPPDLLGRVLDQESHFRPDIVSGLTPSPRGAIGIAQFLPGTAAELGVNPYDPFESIDGAGRYLGGLYDRFGDWALALIAYNWGMGNVSRLGISQAPQESRDYASLILSDVSVFG
jgi:soluble lytic murein transglycosylase-like protein